MRIGIDFTSAVHQGGGIGRLTRELIRTLIEIDREDQFALFVAGGHGLPSIFPNYPHVRTVPSRLTDRWWKRIWHRLRIPLPIEWLLGPLDLFHSPDFTLPPTRPRTRTLLTVHDLSFMRVPHCFEPALLDYLMREVPRSIQHADHIIADSENTRQDLITLLNVPAERISVVYAGVDPRFRPDQDARTRALVRERYHLPERFILSVGTLQPRKQFDMLVKIMPTLLQPHPDLHLVIAGGRGWLEEPLFKLVREMGLEQRVHFLGFVADDDLPTLYNLAEVFALPSLYEGFGLPPLEAMACGVPTVVSDVSSLPEVVGEAAIRVKPDDQRGWAAALLRILADRDLREQLRTAGIARAAQFTWERAAQTLWQIYKRVAGQRFD